MLRLDKSIIRYTQYTANEHVPCINAIRKQSNLTQKFRKNLFRFLNKQTSNRGNGFIVARTKLTFYLLRVIATRRNPS